MPAKECIFYKKLKNEVVKCLACSHYCNINEGNMGICRVRKNIKGKLYLMVYGKAISENIDPVEKKPLYHFLPGTNAYSVGTIGCNFKCSYCQNYEISQESDTELGRNVSPEGIVSNAIKSGCKSIAYTYTEPAIAVEYWMDCMKLAHKEGLKNIFVTNGYMSKEAMKKTAKLIDAMNIDLKAYTEKFYSEVCKAKLKPVLNNIKLAKKLGIWVELTTLIVPGMNDSAKEIESIAKFVKSVDENMPLHLSRYFPMYKMKIMPTPIKTLNDSYRICKRYLKNVYVGNVGEKNDTLCPECRRPAISRQAYSTKLNMKKSKCGYCGKKILGVFE